MNKNIYKIDNSIERVLQDRSTLFLDQKEFNQVKNKLKNNSYKIYYPYKDSEKVILYTKELPNVALFKINTIDSLRHQDILGSILSLNISSSYLGDIIIDNGNYYFYILSELSNFIKDNLLYVGNNKVDLEEINLSLMKDYERKYDKLSVIVASLRIDNVISKVIGTNRDSVVEKIKNKEVIVNYEVLNKNSYILHENDIFSIRKYGKYKYIGIINHTKKDNLVIEYLKYI
ncbi:MAG: hypothetical protein IJ568_06860 [Bacilli bacterium]|nr:hypothetical protein [Bacilli bacterium]